MVWQHSMEYELIRFKHVGRPQFLIGLQVHLCVFISKLVGSRNCGTRPKLSPPSPRREAANKLSWKNN